MLYPCLQYCTRADILELIPMDKRIDFNIIGRDGGNIFYQCLTPAIQFYRRQEFRDHQSPNLHSRQTTVEQSQAELQIQSKTLSGFLVVAPKTFSGF